MPGRKALPFLFVLLLFCPGLTVCAGQEEEIVLEWEDELTEYLDIEEIQQNLEDYLAIEEFSFSGTVRNLISGQIPFSWDEILRLISQSFLHEILTQKQVVLQILIIVLASAIFSNFVKVFENSQIADISFYAMYLLIAVLLMKSFLSQSEVVSQTCTAINQFMKVLLPTYLTVIVISSGTITAIGFYEITLLAMNLLQVLIIKIVLPAIHFYLVLLILNQMSKEDYFSKLAELTETVITWGLKTMMGVVIGLQAVQCLVAPAVDSFKNSTLSRIAKAIPGLGTTLDAAAETVTGSALIIKNAVGVAGIIALLAICLVPVLKLAACILMFRLLCALIQPVSEKRLVDSISSVSGGAVLLLRALFCGLAIFLISLAMVTATVRG